MSCKSSIARSVIRMEDLQRLKVVQRNDFIAGIAKMDRVALKIFDLAVSFIDTEKPPENNTVFIEKEILFSFFNAYDKDRYGRFEAHVKSLHSQAVFHIRYQNKKGIEYETFSGIAKTSWDDYGDFVSVKFTDEIMIFLKDFKQGNFTQYEIKNISGMKHKHSITLYKWLVMNYNQFKYYEYSSKRRVEQKEKLKNPSIPIEELREITDTHNKYELFTNFERKILTEPLKEINEQTNLNVTYEKIKKGRKISAIKFFITEKPIKKAAPLDENYLENRPSKYERERQLTELWSKAVEHKYTKKLSEGKYKILSTADVINKDKMISLMEYVYPLISELESLDKAGVTRVLKRILKYIPDVDDKKLVNYLREAFLNEVNKVKFDKKMNEVE